MPYVIKAEVLDPLAHTFTFTAQKTMYGGKRIAVGDELFIFASENEGGAGLIAAGTVTSATAVARMAKAVRQTPRVSVTVRRTATATRSMGRRELRSFSGTGAAAGPEAELHFKLYRQATNKIAAISDATATFLRRCCRSDVAPAE